MDIETSPPAPTSGPSPSPITEEEETFALKRSTVFAALIPVAFLLGLAMGYALWGRGATPTAQAPPPEAVQAEEPNIPQEIKRYDIPEDDDPVFGPPDAPITIIEFSDYECPYCRKWHLEVWPRLKAAYPDQIRLVYRDFPLTSIHANAIPAASAANCAGEQGQYWEFNELLFSMKYNLGPSAYQSYAEELGLDMQDFLECVSSEKYTQEIQADFEFAANIGVRSTPTFFINGIPVVGAQPFEVFQQLIERELAGEIP